MRNLCIDFGSTFIKFFIYDGQEVLYSDKLSFPNANYEAERKYTVSTSEINHLILKIFEIAKVYQPQRCFLSVQMHGYLLRYSDGSFSDYISWKDHSGDISFPALHEIDYNNNGTALKDNLPLVKLFPQKFDSIHEFFTLGSYITYFLTGHNVTHKTDGCASGFFNSHTLQPLSVIDNLLLPQITHDIQPVGLYQDVLIYTPAGDHQVSFLGSDILAEDTLLLNIGTAALLSTLGQSETKSGSYEKRPYFDNRPLLTVSGLPGGDKLFFGYGINAFLKAVQDAIEKLPERKIMYVGGGAAANIFSSLKDHFRPIGITCVLLENNIGMEGLKKICNQTTAQIGTMLSEVCFSNFPILFKNNKLDFFIIDNEHGAFDYTFLSTLITNARLLDLPAIVRLPDNHRRDITKLADMGASGFLLPMSNCAADIQAVVNYAKYAPTGIRGISTNRAHTFYNPPPLTDYMKSANQKMKVYAQIETQAGVKHIHEILAVPGVDGVFIGPNDLSCDLQCIGNLEPIKEAISLISEAVRAAHKIWGIITTDKVLIQYALAHGVNMISYGSEINMLKDSCKSIRRKVYGE